MIQEASKEDLQELLKLYLCLHEEHIPDMTAGLERVWKQIMQDPNHHIIVAREEGRIVSSCVCVIIPNLTRNARPYALIENVVTDVHARKKGYASTCLAYACAIATAEHCYKIMLMTSSKDENTLRFYERAGFRSGDKTAFIKRLE